MTMICRKNGSFSFVKVGPHSLTKACAYQEYQSLACLCMKSCTLDWCSSSPGGFNRTGSIVYSGNAKYLFSLQLHLYI